MEKEHKIRDFFNTLLNDVSEEDPEKVIKEESKRLGIDSSIYFDSLSKTEAFSKKVFAPIIKVAAKVKNHVKQADNYVTKVVEDKVKKNTPTKGFGR